MTQKEREAKRRWELKNPDYKREYYIKNREKYLQRAKAYALENPKKHAAVQARWRKENLDKARMVVRKSDFRKRWGPLWETAMIANDLGKTIKRKERGSMKPNNTKVISFRVSDEIYSKLEKLAKSEKDEVGLPLNAATFVRRLMLKALEENISNKKSDVKRGK